MGKHEEKPAARRVRRTIPGLLIFLYREVFRQKKLILLPLLVLLTALALALFLSGASFILPAIYIAGF